MNQIENNFDQPHNCLSFLDNAGQTDLSTSVWPNNIQLGLDLFIWYIWYKGRWWLFETEFFWTNPEDRQWGVRFFVASVQIEQTFDSGLSRIRELLNRSFLGKNVHVQMLGLWEDRKGSDGKKEQRGHVYCTTII